jgi:2-phosphosulfolactate phosphatase
MRLEAAFTPALLPEPGGRLCIVIDLLRLTSSLAVMFGRGLDEALVAETVDEARRPAGFDWGNSPSEFAELDLRGKHAVVVTTNGTPAFSRAAECPAVLAGCLLNITATVECGLVEARAGGLDLALLCAGNGRGRYFSLEDAFCAGAMVEGLVRPEPSLTLWSSATAAQRFYQGYGGSTEAALRESDHGSSLVQLGFGRDVTFCAKRDSLDVTPRLHRDRDGLLALRAG